MSKLQLFRVFLNEHLTAATVDIFGEVEKTVVEYQEENDRLRRLLRRTPVIPLCRIESLQLSVSEEEVPPEQQEWSHSLGQEDPETTQIKEEQEEVRTSQEEEQLQGLFDTKDSIFTSSCVKSECDQKDPHQEAILAEHPTLSPLKTSKLQSFRLLLNECLTASAAVEILGAVEETVAEYQEENDLLRRLLEITPEIKLCRIDSLQLSVSEEEVSPEQQHCEQEWSPSLGQKDPETTQIKEEQEEVRTSQQEEQLQGLVDTRDSIFTPSCVKSECDQMDPRQEAILAEHPTLSPVKMSKLQSFREFLNERLTAFAAVEISGVFAKAVAEYQEENDLLRRLLEITPEIKLCRIDSLQFSVSEEEVPSEQQEWSPSLRQEDPEPTQIKEELGTSQEEEQLQGLFDTKDSIFTPSCVKSECDLEDPLQSLTLPQTQTVENRETHSKPVDLKPLSKHMRIHTREKPFICGDCGKSFIRKAHLTRHKLTHTGERPFTCGDCGKSFIRKVSLTEHKLTHTGEKPFSCGDCGKNFRLKGNLTNHKLTHTGEKPFSCGDCGKSFRLKGNLTTHKLTHTGEKPFSCGDCGKSFNRKVSLTEHKLTHTGEKPFSCGDCGKSFNRKVSLTEHKLTHTGEKPFTCDDCGKRFIQKRDLRRHILIHTGEKPFTCDDCGKRFIQKRDLRRHILIHTGEKPFSCGDCGKSFNRKGHLTMHKLTHTGEKPFTCGDCGKRFNRKRHLTMHKLTHTGEKPFTCGDCGKSFIQRRGLRRHILIHTGEKPFSCGD
uniref:Gastrula zinc finger protein XlCGF26.1-like n=1 Tax=Salmo trutta TaxID=8032 RepID=A0A673WT49_SALTR